MAAPVADCRASRWPRGGPSRVAAGYRLSLAGEAAPRRRSVRLLALRRERTRAVPGRAASRDTRLPPASADGERAVPRTAGAVRPSGAERACYAAIRAAATHAARSARPLDRRARSIRCRSIRAGRPCAGRSPIRSRAGRSCGDRSCWRRHGASGAPSCGARAGDGEPAAPGVAAPPRPVRSRAVRRVFVSSSTSFGSPSSWSTNSSECIEGISNFFPHVLHTSSSSTRIR